MKKSFRFFVLFFILLFNFKYLIHANLLEPFEYPKIVKKIEICFTHLNSNDVVDGINNGKIAFKDFVIDCSVLDGSAVYKQDPNKCTHYFNNHYFFNDIRVCFSNVNISDLIDTNGLLVTLIVNFLCSLCKLYGLNSSDIVLTLFFSSDEAILLILDDNRIQNSVKEKLNKCHIITLHKFLGTMEEFRNFFVNHMFKINVIGFSKNNNFIYHDNYIPNYNCAIIFHDESYSTSDDCVRLNFYTMLMGPNFVNRLFGLESCFSPTDMTNVSQLLLEDYIKVSPLFPSLVSFDSVQAIAYAVKTLRLGIVYF